jgi:hypothetical protein
LLPNLREIVGSELLIMEVQQLEDVVSSLCLVRLYWVWGETTQVRNDVSREKNVIEFSHSYFRKCDTMYNINLLLSCVRSLVYFDDGDRIPLRNVCTKLWGFTSQDTVILKFTAVRVSNFVTTDTQIILF